MEGGQNVPLVLDRLCSQPFKAMVNPRIHPSHLVHTLVIPDPGA